jgi:hypothetical protein
MSLRIRIDVNGEDLATIGIQNLGHPDALLTFPDDDDRREYACRLQAHDAEPVVVHVEHRRADGWLALARTALGALDAGCAA